MKIELEEPIPVPTALAYTTLRIVTGVILTAHGWSKLNDVGAWQDHVAKLGIPFPDVAAPLAIVGELLGGIGLTLGLFTRVAAFGGLCVMAAAIGFVHYRAGLFMRDGGFEYPLLIAACACLFMVVGGGRISLDQWQRARARRRAIAMDKRWQYPPYVPGPSSAPPPPYDDEHRIGERAEAYPGYRE